MADEAEATAAATLHVLFHAGGEGYALPLEAVREVVVTRPPFARVPGAHPAVRGAMNLRGRVVAVVELAAVLDLGAEPAAPGQTHVVLLDRGRRGLGLLVGAVLGVEALPPPSPSRAAERGGLVLGVSVSERQGAAVTVLDPDALEEHATSLFASR